MTQLTTSIVHIAALKPRRNLNLLFRYSNIGSSSLAVSMANIKGKSQGRA
jgi:hypothetical protein